VLATLQSPSVLRVLQDVGGIHALVNVVDDDDDIAVVKAEAEDAFTRSSNLGGALRILAGTRCCATRSI
jgi:hypothetical protein